MSVHTDTVGPMTPASRVMEKPPWAITEVLRWFFVAQLGPIVVTVALVAIVFGDEGFPDPFPIWLLIASSFMIWVGYGLGTVLETRRTGSGPVAELGLGAPPLHYLAAAVLGVFTQLVLVPVLYWPIVRMNPDLDVGEAAERLTESYTSPVEIALFCLVAVVAAPVVEELFYRGLMQRGLTHYMHPALALVVSALVFAVIHFQLVQLPGLFMFGLVAGAVFYFTGRVGLAIALHIGFNLTGVVGLFWF